MERSTDLVLTYIDQLSSVTDANDPYSRFLSSIKLLDERDVATGIAEAFPEN